LILFTIIIFILACSNLGAFFLFIVAQSLIAMAMLKPQAPKKPSQLGQLFSFISFFSIHNRPSFCNNKKSQPSNPADKFQAASKLDH